MCGATSLKIIKYKTLPYISNHSIYKFIFSKRKVKDTVIQHNSSFSFLLSTSLKRNSRSGKHSGVMLPTREGSWGAWQSNTSLESVCPESLLQGHSNVEDTGNSVPLKTKWMWNVQTQPPPLAVFHKTWPLLDREILFLRRYPFHLPCPSLLVFSWIKMAYNISLVPQKPEKQFPFSEWQ